MRFVKLCVVVVALVAMVGLADSFAPAQTKKDDDKAAAVFEVYANKGGEFRFRFHGGEQKLPMSVKGYTTKDEELKIIDTIKHGKSGTSRVLLKEPAMSPPSRSVPTLPLSPRNWSTRPLS